MKRSLIRKVTYLQLVLAILMATGCSPTQPFFVNESPDLQYYLNASTAIEYPDVDVASLPETTESLPPLTIGNHDYKFWDLTLEECISIALQNSKLFITTGGNAEVRQNVAAQFTSASAEQVGTIWDVAITQSTAQSIPQTIDGNGNRTLPTAILRANQVGGVEDALAEFDAVVSGFIDFSITDRPTNSGASAVSTVISQATDVTQQANISKRFATGGIATLREQIIYTRNNLPLNPNTDADDVFDPTGPFASSSQLLSSTYTAILEAEIQHPLLRNRGTLVNRIPVVLASLNEDIAIADYEIQVRNLVRDIENVYWDLYRAYRNVSSVIVGRNSAIATAKIAELNLQNGTGSTQDVSQARNQYATLEARLAGALAGSNLPPDDPLGVYGRERVLRELMGLASTDGRLIRPIEEPSIARIEYDWEELRAELLYLAPELRRSKTQLKQLELELISAKNQLLPEVNLSLVYRWVGFGDTLGPPSRRSVNAPLPGSSALGELTEGNFQEGVIRLDITPAAIGARRERTRIRAAQQRIAQSTAFIQEQERLLISQLQDAVSDVATHYRQLQTNAQAWQYAEDEVAARLAEFRGGRSLINVVLQSQQRRADAELNYYFALAEYNKSINYVDYLKGTLLANNGITLREGTWNQKAYYDAIERARERSAGRKVKYGVTRPGVVRRGPVGNADSASQLDSNSIYDATVPPALSPVEESILDGEVFSDNAGSFGDILGSGLPTPTDPVTPPLEQPLTELGTSPAELLQPRQPIEQRSIPNRPLPTPDALPDSIDDAGSGSRSISPLSHEVDVDISGAPRPIRKKAVSIR